jgi:hypothetical protein
MSYCGEHGTSDYCSECMAEPLHEKIAEQAAEIASLNAEINSKADWNMKYLERITVLEAELVISKETQRNAEAQAENALAKALEDS